MQIEADKIRQALRREGFWRWTGISGKTGWDWAQLLVSISIPIVILLAGQIFTAQNNEKQQQLANAKQKDEVLKSYVESIKTLLLDKDHPMLDETQGRHSKNIAQALTFIVLRQLNDKQVNENQANERKGVLIKFLMESNLITTSNSPIVLKRCDLSDADFSAAYLGAANLTAANFMGAHLKNANFSDAILTNASLDVANLSGANLSGAKLTNATLSTANLSGAKLIGADLSNADFSNANLSNANLSNANLSKAILLATDLRTTNGTITKQQLEGQDPPLLCNVALSKQVPVNPDRDCDRLPQELVERKLVQDLENAKQWVNDARQRKWE